MRTSTSLLVLALLTTSACAFEPFGDLDGDSTRGDEGRSRWSLDDGLCPGLGSCALDVPVAVGANVRLKVDLSDRLVAELGPIVTSGSATIADIDRDPEYEYIAFDVIVTGAGPVELSIVDSDGELVDRSRFTAVDPVGLDCGSLVDGEVVRFSMDAMIPEGHELVVYRARDDVPTPQLGCRVTDADGEPLLSADLVHWRVLETDPLLVRVVSNPFDWLADGEADGARVWVHANDSVGTTTLEASFGDRTETFTVTVE